MRILFKYEVAVTSEHPRILTTREFPKISAPISSYNFNMFCFILELLKLVTGEVNIEELRPQPISPELRLEAAKLDELSAQATLLGKNKIETLPQLESFISEKTEPIMTLEKERQQLYNNLKTAKSPESEAEIKEKA